jgi:signal transduction histidine kinase
MKPRLKLRIIGLAAAICLMGLGVVFTTVTSQRQAGDLRTRLRQMDSESFRIADEFRDHLRQLNGSLYRYGSEHDPADLELFSRASDQLNRWIDQQKPLVTTSNEDMLIQQIDSAYDDYLNLAADLQQTLRAQGQQSALMSDYSPLLKRSQRLFDLGQALAKAHLASKERVIFQANHTITQLRVLVLVSLGFLFVFGAVLAIVVYRDMIAPLRSQLVERQTLMERQEKLASLGMLAAGVAHEIRNPLTAIKAALFMQQKRFQPGSPELADARIVDREILRLEKIVNDFLLFARPTEAEPVTMPVGALLQQVQVLLAPQLAKNQIQLAVEPSPPLQVWADPAQLEQVLINLVQNAADAIGHDGVVRMRARSSRKRLLDTQANVAILEVEDNGKGIPLEVQKRLFDPFFTTKDTGTGLGLSIAAGIVQRHGGAIEYQTEMDHGTIFGIILPQVSA